MRAIVYTSNTGSAAKYAKLLSHQICIPSYSMEEAKTKVKTSLPYDGMPHWL